MSKTTRIFLAITCGVGIGLAIGHKLAAWHPLAQWLAPLIGGVVAYLAVDLRGAASAIPRAWEAVHGWDWPTKEDREYIRWWVYAWWSIGMTVGLSIVGLFVILKPEGFNEESYVPCLLMGVCAGWFMFLVALTEAERGIIDCDLPKTEQTKRGLKELKRIVRASFPLVIIFYHLPRGLWWLARYGVPRFATHHIPRASRFVGCFIWHWFRLVHSDMRLLCLMDAALFTGLGLVMGGSILACAILGGLWGVVNYRVVSVRWLKLAPR